jgi:hypothetical protein
MRDLEPLLRIRVQLNRSGRIREILDDEGEFLPSQSAMELVAREHANLQRFQSSAGPRGPQSGVATPANAATRCRQHNLASGPDGTAYTKRR